MIQKIEKTCLCYKENPSCEKTFWCEPKHQHSRVLCTSCKLIETKERKTRNQKERNKKKRIERIKLLEKQLKKEKNKRKKGELLRRINIQKNYV